MALSPLFRRLRRETGREGAVPLPAPQSAMTARFWRFAGRFRGSRRAVREPSGNLAGPVRGRSETDGEGDG
jgi:hypothetical protein